MPGQGSPYPQSCPRTLPARVTNAGVAQDCYAAFFLGTFAPFLRASDRPMAIACFLLFTFPPFPARPERRVPCFFRRMALATLFPALLLYLRPRDFFLAGILIPFRVDKLGFSGRTCVWGCIDIAPVCRAGYRLE